MMTRADQTNDNTTQIHTVNEGILQAEPGLRVDLREPDAFLGYARDADGNRYEIYCTDYGLPNCFCAAKAVKMGEVVQLFGGAE